MRRIAGTRETLDLKKYVGMCEASITSAVCCSLHSWRTRVLAALCIAAAC